MISSIAMVAATVLAAVVLGHSGSWTTMLKAAEKPPAAASFRPLTSMLGVLRRPQISADRDATLLAVLMRQAHRREVLATDGKPVISLVRLAAVTPWGAKVFLVPSRPLTDHEIANLPAPQQRVARAAVLGLAIYSAGTTSGIPSAAQLEGGRDLATPASGRADRYVMVVPDGVSKVALWRSTSIRGHPHRLVAQHSKPVIAIVHNNVAAFRSRTIGFPGREVWYARSGKSVKRIADASSCTPPLGSCA